eukprot:7263707-Alexandrium_andersonii.AAC.1
MAATPPKCSSGGQRRARLRSRHATPVRCGLAVPNGHRAERRTAPSTPLASIEGRGSQSRWAAPNGTLGT